MALTAPRPMSFVVLMVPPMVAAVAGAAAMYFYMSISPPVEQAPAPEPISLVPLDPSIAAEASDTYTLTLARLLADRCGPTETPSLEAASTREEQNDPVMTALARSAAAVRVRTITTDQSCDYVVSEINAAEQRAGSRFLPTVQQDSAH